MWMLKWLGVALLLILLLGFSMMNLDQFVDINLLFWQFDHVPLILVVFEAFVAGMLVWFIIAFVNELKLRSQLRTLSRDRNQVNEELQALRNQPLDELDMEDLPAEAEEDVD